jgi:peptidoglycan/xylan/chitin deacetylase (PgdA/CDA1 family)
MNFYKTILLPVCILILTSCGGNDNNSSANSPEVLGSSSGTPGEGSEDSSSEQQSSIIEEPEDPSGKPNLPVETSTSPSNEQPSSLKIHVERVATWKRNAKAAYSIIHDDYPLTRKFRQHYLELDKRGLHAGFGAIVAPINDNQDTYIPKMQQMVDAGHEIINHSFNHKDVDKKSTDLSQEIDLSTKLLRSYGFDIHAFVFPYDHYNEAVLQRLKGLGYLGARARFDGHKVNQANLNTDDPLAPFHTSFDAFFEDPITGQNTASGYKNQDDVLKTYLDDAIQQGGWAVRELHGIEDNSWGSVSLVKYTAHLDYVVDKVKNNEVWMDTFTHVTRYRSSRAYCGQAIAEDTGTITFSLASSENCTKYATPLSVIITTNGVDDITATQNNTVIPSTRLGTGQYILEINPAAGPAYVSNP